MQDHILNYQLPVAVSRYNVGLVVIDSITANYRAEHASDSVGALSARSGELAKRGQMLRNLAVKADIAIVVANQVSDRFVDEDHWMGAAPPHPPPPPPTTTTTTTTIADDNSKAQSSPAYTTTLLQPPSSSPGSRLPSSSPLLNVDEDAPFDGSYLVSNPVRNEILSLPHQQCFFTGWGDDPSISSTLGSQSPSSSLAAHSHIQKSSSSPLKTPALGFVWSTQVACRIALKKNEEDVNDVAEHDGHDGNGSGNGNHVNDVFTTARTEQQREAFPVKKRAKSSIDSDENSDNNDDIEEWYCSSEDLTSITGKKRRKKKKHSPSQNEDSRQLLPPRLRRTIKLVFSPWTGGWISGNGGEMHDEVDFEIWKGGIRGV